MTMNDSLIKELQIEAANTRKMLERVPAEHFDYKPHEKSMDLKFLSTHVADLIGWTGYVLTTTELDFVNNDLKEPVIQSTEDLLSHFDEVLQSSLSALETATAEQFAEHWVLRNGDFVILEQPRAVVIRSMCLSHLYHHRGQLSVYLRMLNIPVPGMYGPSADEM
jgi:uncharacterized damage-inducible protein DinB